jgi:hypothetical protein
MRGRVWVEDRHKSQKVDLRLLARHLGRVAGRRGEGDGGGVEGEIGDGPSVPPDVEEAFAIDVLLSAVVVNILGDPEGDVRNVEDRHEFRDEDILTPKERTDEILVTEAGDLFGTESQLLTHRFSELLRPQSREALSTSTTFLPHPPGFFHLEA